MIVVAVNANQVRAIDLRVEDLRRLQVRGDENVGLQAQARRAGGHRVGQVAGRRAAHGVESKSLRIGQSHGNHSVFEAESRQAYGVVFDIEIAGPDAPGKARRFEQRSHARRRGWLVAVRYRQQRPVAPHVQRS